ncbi:MAG: MarR family winged helix-turn-helix transcriptional regulator [Solirubrobacterales bacterium]
MGNLNSNLLREIGALSRCINSINDVKFKEINLQKGQFTFLTRICENKGINLIDLSNLLKVDKTTTTKAIQKLIEAGYIFKKRDEADKRMWRLYPEDKAQEVYSFIIEEENRSIDTCLHDFTMEEKELVNRLIIRMRENIENDWKDIKNF